MFYFLALCDEHEPENNKLVFKPAILHSPESCSHYPCFNKATKIYVVEANLVAQHKVLSE